MKVAIGVHVPLGGPSGASTFACDFCGHLLVLRRTYAPQHVIGERMESRRMKTVADWLECMNETCENNGQRWAVPTIELKLLD